MPISIPSMRATDGLPPSQKTTPAARAAGMPGDVSEPSASRAVAHAMASEADKPGAGQLQQAPMSGYTFG